MKKTLLLTAAAAAAFSLPFSTQAAGGWLTASNTPCKVWIANATPGLSVTWSGKCSPKGFAMGKGTYQKLINGKVDFIYDVEFKDGKMLGKGTVKTESGYRWEGVLGADGFLIGKGSFFDVNGDKYVGDWKDGKQNGSGTFTWAHGSTYEGEWKDGNRHGFGKLTLIKDDPVLYSYENQGTWVGDKYVVQGMFESGNNTSKFLFSCPNKAACQTQMKAYLDKQKLKRQPGTRVCLNMSVLDRGGHPMPFDVVGVVEMAPSSGKVKVRVTEINTRFAYHMFVVETEGQRVVDGADLWITPENWTVCQ